MSEIPKEILEKVLDGLDARAVLEFIGYRTDTIQESDKSIRCFCPVHKEEVFRTFTVEKDTKKGKCSYTPCPARKSMHLIKLVAMVKEEEEEEALAELVQHFGLSVDVPGVGSLLDKRLETAKQRLGEGDLNAAFTGFRHVLSLEPENATALEGMVRICEKQNRTGELGDLEKRLAGVHFNKGRLQEAAGVYERYLQHSPSDVEIRLHLAECRHSLGQKEAMIGEMVRVAKIFEENNETDKALEIYRRIDTLKPESIDIGHAIMDLLVKVGRADEAIAQVAERARRAKKAGYADEALMCYRQILQIDPRRDEFRQEFIQTVLSAPAGAGEEDSVIGQCLELAAGFTGGETSPPALQSLEGLRERYPGSIAVLKKLQGVYHSLGREEDALALREQLSRVYLNQAQELLKTNQTGEAYAAFESAVDLHPDNAEGLAGLLKVSEILKKQDAIPILRRRLADLYTSQRRYEEAIPIYEKYLEVCPEDMDSRLQFVECLHALGRGSKMLEELKNVARAFAKANDIEKAIGIYRRISAFDVDDEAVNRAVVELLVKAGRSGEAAEHISTQADRYRLEGRNEEALACYRQILDLNPERDDVRLKYLQTVTSSPSLKPEDLQESLYLMDGFVQENWSNMALQILEDLRSRFPGNPTILEKIYQVYRSNGRDSDADALAFDLAQNFLECEDYQSALKWIDPLITQGGPGRHIALSLKANICKAMGSDDEAVSALLLIIDENEARQQFEDALPFYESVLEIAPDNLELQKRRIKVLVHLGGGEPLVAAGEEILPILKESKQETQALEILEDLVKQAPLHSEFLVGLASALTKLGRDGEARKALLQAAELFADQELYEKAVEILTCLLELDPHDLAALEKLADFRLSLGQEEEALAGYRSLADLYGEQGSQDAQLDVLLKISEVKSDDTEVLKQILRLYEQLENTRDAKELREKMIRVYIARKAWPDALQLCQEALKGDPRDLFCLEASIRVYEGLDQPEQLRESALSLLDVYRTGGEVDRAVKLAEQMASRFPEDQTFLELRLLALCEAGNWNVALDTLDKLVEIHEKAGQPEEALAAMRGVLGSAGAPAGRLLPPWLRLCRVTGTFRKHWSDTEKLVSALESGRQAVLAADTLREIIGEEPDFDPARERYVALLRSTSQNQKAVEALEEWARLCLSEGQIDKADRLYQQALEIDSQDLHLLSEILEFRSESDIQEGTADLALRVAGQMDGQGLVSQAIEALEMGLRADPGREDLRRRILELEDVVASPSLLKEHYLTVFGDQNSRQQYEMARATITEAVGRFPGDLALHRKLAELLKTMELRAEQVAQLSSIATIQMETGELTAALQTAGEILEIEPGNTRAQALHAEIEERLSTDAAALEEFRRLIQSYPGASPEKILAMLTSGEIPARPKALEMLPILKEYNFDTFIVGTRNNFAYATALAVAKTPGGDYNPLFLYGDVGLGKTHLLHAIANELVRANPNVRLLYTSSEEFTNALIESIQNNTIREFRALHKSPDVFLIDDIHGLAEKERAQEEFFQIFNTLYQANKQIVMTSDRPPKDIAHLERRLRSRFGAGIIVDIQPPDLETRVAILRHHLAEGEATLPDDIINQLAQTIESNIRELKSALTQILARIRLTQQKPTPDVVKQIVEQIRE